MSFSWFKPTMIIVLAMIIFSCVKDVDLSQSKDISLQPELEVDLIITSVEETDFNDESTNQLRKVIRDTVRLEFLDDDYIQEDLVEVEFSFRYLNSFPEAFNSTIYFLAEDDQVQYTISIDIGPGNKTDPTYTEHIEFIGEDRINVVKRSIKLVIEIEVLSNSPPLNGKLDLASKGLFSFEF